MDIFAGSVGGLFWCDCLVAFVCCIGLVVGAFAISCFGLTC